MAARWLLAAIALAGGVPCTAAALAPPRVVRASAGDLFNFADNLARGGDPASAEAVLTLLSEDPNSDVRNEARFRRSKLLVAEGKQTSAALLLRQILDEKPDAAPVRLELAQLLEKMGDKEDAWRQVRAVRASGLPPAVARLVDRYSEALRAARPVGASFEIALAPDSNINRATRSNRLGTIFGDFDINGNSKAKSGTGLSLRGQSYRRFALGGRDSSLLVSLSGYADLYRKMKFNDVAVDLSAGPELRLGRDQLNFEVGGTERWFGQKPFTRSARFGVTWTRPVGSVMQLRVTGTAALVDNQVNDLEDGKSYAGRIELERALSATSGVGLNLSRDREALRDPGYSTTGWRAGLISWHDTGRMTFTAEAEFGTLHADKRLLLFPDERSERYSRLSFGATFRQLRLHGFAPVARLTVERNRSTIEFYDYRRVQSEVGVVRAF